MGGERVSNDKSGSSEGLGISGDEARGTMSTYTVQIQHDDDGELDVSITDAGSSEQDRAAIAWALREAARMVEEGLPIERGMFS
jgi:succinyl-CoA synthetase alpha subunit